ncbi:MAG: hypothetical protein AAGC93_11685 [Cyanobacteria bacterium P01_F01_bin.53]
MTGFILPLAASDAQSSTDANQVASISQFHQNIFAFYTLKWRQNILWVSPQANQATLAPVPVQQLVDRLKQSPVRCVCVDSALGEAHLKTWSEACAQAGKRLHLRIPKGSAQKASTLQSWTAKRFFQHSFRRLGLPLPKVIAALAR